MKIEKLNNNKIKIIFNLNEISCGNINSKDFNINNLDLYSLLNSALRKANEEVGFNVDKCKIFVEAYYSTDNLTFVIAKFKDKISNHKFSRKFISNKFVVYRLKNFDDFCEICTYISKLKHDKFKNILITSSLFEYNNNFFLIFDLSKTDKILISMFLAYMGEFSDYLKRSSSIVNFLNERGNSIFKSNAVYSGIKFFINI